jgi:hypothetical protein
MPKGFSAESAPMLGVALKMAIVAASWTKQYNCLKKTTNLQES